MNRRLTLVYASGEQVTKTLDQWHRMISNSGVSADSESWLSDLLKYCNLKGVIQFRYPDGPDPSKRFPRKGPSI